MVNREQRKAKAKTWRIYFPNKPKAKTWMLALKRLVEEGRAHVSFRTASKNEVHVTWEKNAVTCASVARLIRSAQDEDESFEIVGEPFGIENDQGCEDGDTANERSDIADEEEAAPVGAVAQAADEGVEPGGKRRRLRCKTEIPQADHPAGASSTEPAKACREAAQAASACGTSSPWSSPRLLAMKSENICHLFDKVPQVGPSACSKYAVNWDVVLGVGSYGEVHSAIVRGGVQQPVAIKMLTRRPRKEQGACAEAEVMRYCALSSRPNIVKLLDIGLFRRLDHPCAIGLVFERFDCDLRQFLRRTPLKLAGMRHVLRSVIAALAYMHDLGVIHADLKPANILLRGAGAFPDSFLNRLAEADAASASDAPETASASAALWPRGSLNVDVEPLEVICHLPASFQVVLADIGCAELANPDHRVTEINWTDLCLPFCTAEYRAPDLFLGSHRFGADLDMWSLGCVAAEMFLRRPLFRLTEGGERSILDAHFALLGVPPSGSSTLAWMKSLPFTDKLFGKDAKRLPANLTPPLSEWPPERLRGCPKQLADFVGRTLQWHPLARMDASTASLHQFVSSRALGVTVDVAQGKNGLGSIAEGCLDDEVLEYLQTDPTWEKLHAECRRNKFEPNSCICEEEGELRMKREFVGYIDAENPPRVKSLNSDKKLEPIASERLACFVMAFRQLAKPWLQQLTTRVRAEIRRLRLPEEFLRSNGGAFTEEDFADNAFVYASVQLLKVGEREDGWHTDGGASLLHAAVTLFGRRTLLVKKEDGSCISLPQRPGSFYVGNFCALEHNVVHGEHADTNYGEGPPSEQVQIAVMLRTDVYRAARARRINATPGPAELFRIVNTETARHLAEQPLYIPDLAAVIAESRESCSPSPASARPGCEAAPARTTAASAIRK